MAALRRESTWVLHSGRVTLLLVQGVVPTALSLLKRHSSPELHHPTFERMAGKIPPLLKKRSRRGQGGIF